MAKPNQLLQGMIAKKIAKIMDDESVAFDKAFVQFKKNASETYSKWDLDSVKDNLAAKALTKCKKPVAASKEAKKPKKGKEKSVQSEIKPPMESPAPAVVPAVAAASAPASASTPASADKKKKYVPPVSFKMDGRMDVIPTENGAVYRKDPKGKLAILCGDNATGEVIDENTLGCYENE